MGKKDYFQIQSMAIEGFLSGVRDNDRICTNHKTARKLEKKYNITLKEIATINANNDLRRFLIICK